MVVSTRPALLRFIALLFALFAIPAAADLAYAAPEKSPLGIALPSGGQDEAAASRRGTSQASTWDKLWVWMVTQQAKFKRAMSAAVRDLKSGSPWYPAMVISALAFAYGVLHAAGPGHGKAIISSYVLANERTLRRGIMLSFLAAFIQALTAITFVGVFALALKATSMTIRSAQEWTETLSWALVAAVGAWLLFRQLKLLFPAATSQSAAHANHAHRHAHDHDHGHHEHGPDCGCGHSHAPDARQLDGDLSWSKAFAIAFAVGIRPCTGALALLFLTLTQGLLWAGILGTFAMALGTAITVSILASLAIGSREFVNRFGGEGSNWSWRIERAAGVLGSSLILLMGSVFFVSSLQQTGPL